MLKGIIIGASLTFTGLYMWFEKHGYLDQWLNESDEADDPLADLDVGATPAKHKWCDNIDDLTIERRVGGITRANTDDRK